MGAYVTKNAEKYRWLGPLRYAVAALIEIFWLRDYNTPILGITAVPKDKWSPEYCNYWERNLKPESPLRNEITTIDEQFSNITFNNNPAFYETADPDGVPFVKLQDPYFAITLTERTTRFNLLQLFVNCLKGKMKWTQMAMHKILLANACTAEFSTTEDITIDGECYQCRTWKTQLSNKQMHV